jgi:hypothetical protein
VLNDILRYNACMTVREIAMLVSAARLQEQLAVRHVNRFSGL